MHAIAVSGFDDDSDRCDIVWQFVLAAGNVYAGRPIKYIHTLGTYSKCC